MSYLLSVEPRLEPPAVKPQACCRCGRVASWANSAGYFCTDCMEELADDKYESMDVDDKAEWAGFEAVEYG